MEIEEFFRRLQKTASFGLDDPGCLEPFIAHLPVTSGRHVLEFARKYMPISISPEMSWSELCFYTPEILGGLHQEMRDEAVAGFFSSPYFRIGGIQSNDAFGIDVRDGSFVRFDEFVYLEPGEDMDDYTDARFDSFPEVADYLFEFLGGDFPFDEE